MTPQGSSRNALTPVTLPAKLDLPPDTLRGRVLLLTGAASGLGRAAALALADAGAQLILIDRNLKGLEQLYDEIVDQGGIEPVLHAMNFEGVTINKYIEMASAIDRQFHRLDGLLHNAAALGELSPLSQYDADLWGRTLHVNLNAPFILNQVLLPLLQRADDARLIFVTDSVGRDGRAFWGAYGVSKAAGEQMMAMLTSELGPDNSIRALVVDPGLLDTPLRRRAYPGEAAGTRTNPATLGSAWVYLFSAAGSSYHGSRVSLQPD